MFTEETVSRYCLPSGAVLLVRKNIHSPSVVIRAVVRAGSVDDPPEHTGLSGFMANMLTRGTHTRSAMELWETAESLGALFSVTSKNHTLQFHAKCLAEDTFTLLDLLGDMQRNPTFPHVEIERTRGETLTAIEEQSYSTEYVASRTFAELVYPTYHPNSRPGIGTLESVGAITRREIEVFYAQTVRVRPLVIAVVGHVEPEMVRDYIIAHWEEGAQRVVHVPPLPTVPPRQHAVQRHVVVNGKVQIDLMLGGLAPRRTDDDFDAAELANVVLGEFGLMGRLGASVREDKGLAYYVSSELSASYEPGIWASVAGVAPEHYRDAVDTIRDELARMCTEPVPDAEFADCKSSVIGGLPLALESNSGVAELMLAIELYNLGWDYVLRFPDRIAAITQEDVMNVVQRYLNPEKLILASAGPALHGSEGVT